MKNIYYIIVDNSDLKHTSLRSINIRDHLHNDLKKALHNDLNERVWKVVVSIYRVLLVYEFRLDK